MPRRLPALLALPLFALGLAGYASAAPVLVELKIKDAVGDLGNQPSSGGDQISLSGKSEGKGLGKGRSNEKGSENSEKSGGNAGGNSGGNFGNSNGTGDLKSLTLWLSTDGKEWKVVSNDLLAISGDKITAQINGKEKKPATELFQSMGTDITGESNQVYYVGLSTSSTSFSGGRTLSARLVSWQYVSKTGSSITTAVVPEPSVWPLFAAGALGLGFALRSRRKR